MRTVLLDNEAVAALADPTHQKHRVVVAHLAGVVVRRRKGTPSRVMVATGVRVEAGWDRAEPGAAVLVKAMACRIAEQRLRAAGCRVEREGGRQTVWACPWGAHRAPVPRHNTISAGVVSAIDTQMACLPKGWLR